MRQKPQKLRLVDQRQAWWPMTCAIVFIDLKATCEWQENGTGILRQAAKHPIGQVYQYTMDKVFEMGG